MNTSSQPSTNKVRKKQYYFYPYEHISSTSTYSCIKIPLNSILKNDVRSNKGSMLDVIKNAVSNMHIILTQSSFFLKLYLMDLFHKGEAFDFIDEDFLRHTMSIISVHSGRGAHTKDEGTEIRQKLTQFYNINYLPLIADSQNYLRVPNAGLTQGFLYSATTLLTAIKNNIIAQYRNRISQYINLLYGVTKKSDKDLKNKARLIKIGFFNHEIELEPSYVNEIIALRQKFLPRINYYIEHYTELDEKGKKVKKTRNHILNKTRLDGSYILEKNSVDYDLRANTIDYLWSLFSIALEIDRLQLTIDESHSGEKNYKPQAGKFFNVLPLMKSNIHSCVRFDTDLLKNLSSYREGGIWERFFKNIPKRKGFKFHSQIITNGEEVSILYMKTSERTLKLKKNTNFESKVIDDSDVKEHIIDKVTGVQKTKERYLLDLMPDQIKSILGDKRVVTVDPNKDDIIYCASPKNKEHDENITRMINANMIRFYQQEEKRKARLIKKGIVNENNPFIYKKYDNSDIPNLKKEPKDGFETFRYTNNQRKVETGQKRYRELRKLHKLNYPWIQEVEDYISGTSCKTLYIENYKEYIRRKLKYMKYLDLFYNDSLSEYNINMNVNKVVNLNYKKLRFNIYINTQRSEANMINRFRLKFGEPDKVLILFGDGGQQHIKYKDPVKNKGMINLFRKAGYTVYLINEFRTSMLCYFCSSELTKIKGFDSPRPWRIKEQIVYGGKGCCNNVDRICYHMKNKEILIENHKCCDNMKYTVFTEKEKITINGLKLCDNEECLGVKNNRDKLCSLFGISHEKASKFLNRDKNATMNMYKIFENHLNGKKLQAYSREFIIKKDPSKILNLQISLRDFCQFQIS